MIETSTSKLLASLLQGLDWLYDKAVTGIPALDSASDLAAHYRLQFPSHDEAIDALIKWQMAKAGTASFVSSFGGVLSLPVTLPASLASVTYIHVRMIAAIAHLRGHDLESDAVRTIALACLCGSRVADVIKDFGIRLGTQVAHEALKRVSGDGLKQLNLAIGCRLLAMSGGTASLNVGKLVPVLGGMVSGGVDAAVTRSYGVAAKRVFLPVV